MMAAIMSILLLFLPQDTYLSQNQEESRNAIQFIGSRAELNDSLLKSIGDTLLWEYALSIVAPEISQYSIAEDAMQIGSMAILYTQKGLCNFSIGPLQMKPSFAERLETILKDRQDMHGKHGLLIIPDTLDIPERRLKRLERLSSLLWQVKYLSLFIDIALEKTETLGIPRESIKTLKYLATLYNSGIDLSKEDIERSLQKNRFPRFSYSQYNYADIAVDFFHAIQEKRH